MLVVGAANAAEPAGRAGLRALGELGALLVDAADVSLRAATFVYSCSIEGQRFEVPLDVLVDAYWTDYEPRGGDQVAFELINDLAKEHRPGLVDAIRALAAAASGDGGKLAYLGAGVLEDTLRFSLRPPSLELVRALDAAAR